MAFPSTMKLRFFHGSNKIMKSTNTLLMNSSCVNILMNINRYEQRGEIMNTLNGWPFEPLDNIRPEGIGGGGGPTPG
jgi:hypothetical protein